MLKKIFITGSAGYLGSRIAKALMQTSQYRLVLCARSQPNCQDSNTYYVNADFSCDGTSVSELSKMLLGVDCVIHLASMGDKACLQGPIQANDVNVGGVIKLLEAAKIAGVKRVIYFSTAHVYGNALNGEVCELTLPRPKNVYAITHRAAEDYIYMEDATGNIDSVILRLSNGIGAPTHVSIACWHLLINDVCRQIASCNKVILHSSGMQYRDFITVADIIDAIKHFIEISNAKTQSLIFNLGSGLSMRVLEMVELISERAKVVLGKKIVVKRQETDAIFVNQPWHYCIDRLRRSGFVPKNDFIQEIDKLLIFCQKYFSGKGDE